LRTRQGHPEVVYRGARRHGPAQGVLDHGGSQPHAGHPQEGETVGPPHGSTRVLLPVGPQRTAMSQYVVTALVSGLLLGAARGRTEGEARKEVQRFQGSWRVVSGVYGGQVGDDAQEYTVVFDKDTFAIKRRDQVVLRGRFRPDPSKTPRAIDMVVTDEDGEEE